MATQGQKIQALLQDLGIREKLQDQRNDIHAQDATKAAQGRKENDILQREWAEDTQ